ncbi:hypothetical protein, partial [Nocardioides sp. R-C-SC26]|uniref:hypothetical protein n=1 Tax=Nocardioides sp. R-C-SC26 TaxID=2870414 RepID=UPI001E6564C4
SPSADPAPSGEVDLTKPPRTYAEALAHAAQIETAPERVVRFETNDGTYCVLESEFLPFSCELARGGTPAPEVWGDGPSQNVGRIEVVDGVPQPVCNTDTIREPDAVRLAV